MQVVVFMPEGDRTRMGGTMRLGSRVTVLRPGSRAFELYGGKGTEELEVRCRIMIRGSSIELTGVEWNGVVWYDTVSYTHLTLPTILLV